MRMCASLASVILLFVVSPLSAADHRVEKLNEPAPTDQLSSEIAGQLNSTGFRIVRGSTRTVCDIWFCSQWPVPADFEANNEVLYPFRVGQLVGVARYPRKGGDFRDQDIEEGVYTLRYAQQPVDGNHIGTSPTRDFLLLVQADADKSADDIDYEELALASAEAAGSTHPALLCMQRIRGEAASPSIRHDERHDWWIVRLHGKTKAGEKVAELPMELVVAGYAAE